MEITGIKVLPKSVRLYSTVRGTTGANKILVVGCKDPSRTKTMEFGLFTIEVPYKWQQVKQNGIDSYLGEIAVDNTGTLYFDLGMYSNSLTEHNIEVITRQMMEESATDSSDYIIVKDMPILDLDLDADLYRM